jgi:hypothetical protein
LPTSFTVLAWGPFLRRPLEQQRVELVERKGQGHPDSICDAVAEAASLALCREYLGFVDGRIHGWTGYQTSSCTEGALVTARKSEEVQKVRARE